MGMTPDSYFEAFVAGNLRDFEDEPGDLRRAFNAAVSASHLADHYYNYNARYSPERVAPFRSIGAWVEYLASQTSGAFRDIRSISNVYKHLYSDPKHLDYASVLSGGALESVRSADPDSPLGEVESQYEESEGQQGIRGFVKFTRKDGSSAEFLPVLHTFVAYWSEVYAYEDE